MMAKGSGKSFRPLTVLTVVFPLLDQAFYPVMSTIFTSVKGNDSPKLRIPLMFLENDADIDRWIQIEDKYVKYLLPDGAAFDSKEKRKPFSQHDFKTLYGLRTEDINYLADLVDAKKIWMKSSKRTKANPYVGTQLPTLPVAGARERLVRAMKSKLMCHYCQHPLPSRSPEYVLYTAAEWEAFASRMKITREQLEFKVDKSLTTVLGKEWILARMRPLNKTFDPNLCPESVKAMWKTYMSTRAEPIVEESLADKFGKTYFCKVMDEKSWNITSILVDPAVQSWRGKEKPHMYVWFLFEAVASGPRAKLLENHKLKRLFDALEC